MSGCGIFEGTGRCRTTLCTHKMLHDDVADVDADPKLDRIGLGATGIVLAELSLDFDCAGDGVHSARELHQRAVAHELDDPSCMGGNRRINKLAPQGIQTGKSPGLVQTHKARVTYYVGRQNCCEPPLEAFFGHADVLREGPTDMSLWLTWQSVYLGANDRFGSRTAAPAMSRRGSNAPHSRHEVGRLARLSRANSDYRPFIRSMAGGGERKAKAR